MGLMVLNSDGLAYINALKNTVLLAVPIPFLMAFKLFCVLAVLYGKLIHSTPLVPRTAPSVTLSYGTFQGMTTDGVDYFLGMPFAQATRFGLPEAPSTLTGVQSATAYGAACPQQPFELGLNMTSMTKKKRQSLEESEDCLFVNVLRPAGTAADANLPVLFWIFGGGFEAGDTSEYDGTYLVTRSVQLNEPVIYVSANYRLNAFGFLASSEVQAAGVGNLGLRDQRFALEWAQSNVALFGGNPDKVTLYGQSAGAVSIGLQMVINNGNPAGLFQAAIMESGSPVPLTSMDSGQGWYDQIVSATGCSDAEDTLSCLTTVPYDTLYNAVQDTPSVESYLSLNLVWKPRIDGDFIAEDPTVSVQNGDYAKIPFISGDVDDEGTYFSINNQNITTDDEAVEYMHNNYLPTASDAQFAPLVTLYPSDPTQGSPFNTGTACQLTPEYKRLAAFQGDYLLQAPRRSFMQTAATTQNIWGYLYKRGKNSSCLGSAHGNELPEFYGPGGDNEGTDAIINFVNNFNPNTIPGNSDISSLISWPQYGSNLSAPPLLTFTDPDGLVITDDTYRAEGIQTFISLFPFYDV